MLQLYYTLGSPPSRAVLQTIRILGLDVEVKNVNLMNGEQLAPEYKIINPLHQVRFYWTLVMHEINNIVT